MKLTHQMFEAGRSEAGGINVAQVKALGLTWTGNAWPPAGWPARLIGSEISDEQYAEFLNLRGNKKERARRSTPELLPPGIAKDRDINFDRPRLEKSNIGTHAIACRFMAGESVAILAEDYGVPTSEIELALRVEFWPKVPWVDLAKSTGGPMKVKTVKIERSPENFANQLFEQSGRDLS